MSELRFVALDENGEEKGVITDIFNYVLLTTRYRKIIQTDIINKERFWTIQNNLKLFPFFYEELVKS
jgi:hypothetical protein